MKRLWILTMVTMVVAGCDGSTEPTCTGSKLDGGVACDDGGPGKPVPRLRAMRAYADDGFEQVVSGRVWDNLRGEECGWRDILEADGLHTRCLPAFEWLKPGSFADPACTQRVHWQAAPCVSGRPNYVRDDAVAAPWQTCPVQLLDALYPLGDALPVGSTIYSDASRTCVAATVVDALNAVRPLGSAAPPSAFVDVLIAPEPIQ